MTWLFLRSPVVQLVGAGLLFLASLALLAMLITAKGETRYQTKRADKFETAINAPGTGYIARLATCQGNLAQVRSEMDAQSSAVEALRLERDEAVSKGQKALKAAQRETEGARRAIARVRAMKPKSSDYCTQAQELEAFLRGPA